MRRWLSSGSPPAAVGIAVEAALLALAMLLGGWWGIDPWRSAEVSGISLAAGLLFTVPLVALLAFLVRSHALWAVRLTRIVDQVGATLLETAGPISLLLLALAAGVAEETLFRGVLQAAAQAHVGTLAAVILVGALFGTVHMISLAYALIATGMGLYLGAMLAVTGNLFIPIVVHAAYDFAALLFFRHRMQARASATPGAGAARTEL
jgi:uncharacterized protein